MGEREGWYRGRPIKGDANLCTDPACFAAKKTAHLKRQAEALAAKGKTVVDGNKARQAISAQGEVKGAYVALKDVREQLKKATKGTDKPATVTIQDPRTGKTVEAVKREDLQAAGVKLAEPRNDRANHAAQEAQRKAEHERAEAQCKVESEHRWDLLQRVRTAAAATERSAFDLGLVARAALQGVEWDDRPTLARLWGAGRFEDLAKKAGSMPAGDLTTLLLDIALVANVRCERPHQLGGKPEALMQAAKHYGVPLLEPAAEGASTPPRAARAPKGAKTRPAKAKAAEKEVKDDAGVAGESEASTEDMFEDADA